MKIQDILQHKDTRLITAQDDSPVLDAIHTMHECKIGAVLVFDIQQQPVGILTERDILRLCATQPEKLSSTRVKDAMTRVLVVLPQDAEIQDAMTIMTERKFRHLPIVDDDQKIIGMISIGDLVKARMEESEVEARYLRDYIAIA